MEGAIISYVLARSFRDSVYIVGIWGGAAALLLFSIVCIGYLACCTFCVWPLRRRWTMNKIKRRKRERSAMLMVETRANKDAEEGDGEGTELLRLDVEGKATRWREARSRGWNVFKVWGWFFIIIVGAIPIWSVVMDHLYIWVGVPISVAWVWLCWFLFFPFSPPQPSTRIRMTTNWSEDDGKERSVVASRSRVARVRKLLEVTLLSGAKRGRKRPLLFAFGFIGFLVLIVCVAVTWEGLCISEYPFELSTRFSRRFESSTCAGKAPCHVYLRLAQQVDSSIYVHFHYSEDEYMERETPLSVVYYDTESHKTKPMNQSLAEVYRYSALGHTYTWRNRETKRRLHIALLTNLTANTIYYFRAGYGTHESRFSAERQFLSGPSGSDDYSFVNGGDMGLSDAMKSFSKLAASLSPRFALIGGDIAYANAMETCYRRWDRWFDSWEANMVTPEGNYIAMATAIGNHESGGRYPHIDVDKVPFYFDYLTPAVMTPTRPVIPGASSIGLSSRSATSSYSSSSMVRRTYYSYYIGDRTLIVALDSSMAMAVPGPQTEWLEATLKAFWEKQATLPPDVNYTARVIAFYHVPMWSSEVGTSTEGTLVANNWGPLFAKYNVSVALEHHTHRYGRTFMRLGQEVYENGTLHVGGGGWGVPASGLSEAPPKYMQKVVIKQHILHVSLQPHNITVEALDSKGRSFDTVPVFLR